VAAAILAASKTVPCLRLGKTPPVATQPGISADTESASESGLPLHRRAAAHVPGNAHHRNTHGPTLRSPPCHPVLPAARASAESAQGSRLRPLPFGADSESFHHRSAFWARAAPRPKSFAPAPVDYVARVHSSLAAAVSSPCTGPYGAPL